MAEKMSSSKTASVEALQKEVENVLSARDVPPEKMNKLFEQMKEAMSNLSAVHSKCLEQLEDYSNCDIDVSDIRKKLTSVMEEQQEDQGPNFGGSPTKTGPGQSCDQSKMSASSTVRPGQGHVLNIPVQTVGKQGMSKSFHVGDTKASAGTLEVDWEKKAESRETELKEKETELKKKETEMKKLKEDLDQKQTIINQFEEQVNDNYNKLQTALFENEELKKEFNAKLEEVQTKLENNVQDNTYLRHKNKSLKKTIEENNYEYDSTVRKMTEEIDNLTKSRDDLRDRFSKVAGQKLNENNPDIADLSDPNRAMKLSERFSAVYDDQWTDAFQEQQEKMKKRETKDVVKNLLDVLKVCYKFCEDTAKSQMDILCNVFQHPCQDAGLERNPSAAGQQNLLNKPRIKSAQEKVMKDLRRKIATDVAQEVKDQFLAKMRKDPSTDKKAMECSMTYYEKCAEVCWLMVLHDPPVHMGVEVEAGARMDPNLYTPYQHSGSVIEYLVWPPLFNGKGGGLLSKGTAQPVKEAGKGRNK